MGPIVYALCALASFVCALLLLRSYHGTRVRLLWWSALCFIGLVVNNVLLLVDFLIGPSVDLSLWRTGAALAALLVMLVGLVGELR